MGLLKNIINNIKKITNKKNIANECYLYTDVIYNAEHNFIILISFSKDYFNDAIEFLSACSSHDIRVKYAHSSYEEPTGVKDDDGYDIYNIHEKHYILIGGNDAAYVDLYNKIDNISNNILQKISLEIANHRCSSNFNMLIKDYIFEGITFKYNNTRPEYDQEIKVMYDKIERRYDDVNAILFWLPQCFSGQNLLKFINCYKVTYRIITAYDLLRMAYDSDKPTPYIENYVTNIFSDMYKAIIKNPCEAVYRNFIGPQYLVQDDESIPGNISDESLDELFRQQYDRFNAVADNNVLYKDIDEKLGDNEETENMKESDKIFIGESEE